VGVDDEGVLNAAETASTRGHASVQILKSRCLMAGLKQYILLRTAGSPRSDPLATTLDVGGPAGGDPSFTVEVVGLTAAEAKQLSSDRTVRYSSQSIPARLVTPRPTPGGRHGKAVEKVAWGVVAVGADKSPYSGQGVKVGVLDTGINLSHPAFADVKLVCENFTEDKNPADAHGHGTHVAGTLFGRLKGGPRIGVAPGINSALIGKVLDEKGQGTTAGILRGMEWAERQGARIIVISLGFDFPELVKELKEEDGLPEPAAVSCALELYRANLRLFDAMSANFKARTALGGGALVIAAAGNESDRDATVPYEVFAGPPAVADGFVAVSALARSSTAVSGFAVAPFSNAGADVSAPGVAVLSAALKDGLVSYDGTSMATPHVAGVAALWTEKLITEAEADKSTPAVTPSLIRAMLIGHARYLRGLDPDAVGRGLVVAPQA
jgi:subtilisin family serine protease